ncbi:MAG: DUF1330 domain-containing protein [Hyphomonadaceae bacterium]
MYVLAQLRIDDPGRYARYRENFVPRFADVCGKFGGRLLAADEAPLVIEGV